MTQYKKIDGENREILTARSIENQEIVNRDNRKRARIAAGMRGATEEEMQASFEKYGAALNAENVCPVCFRDYDGHVQEDGIRFCTSEDCPSHPNYVQTEF